MIAKSVCRDITPIMENQLEHDMETLGPFKGYIAYVGICKVMLWHIEKGLGFPQKGSFMWIVLLRIFVVFKTICGRPYVGDPIRRPLLGPCGTVGCQICGPFFRGA